MSDYQAVYEGKFVENLRRYAAIRQRVRRRVARVIADPFINTEFLGDISGKLNLRGCRSARIDQKFRIIFVICEECRRIPQCEFCFCEGLSDQTVVFLTVGPHDHAYAMK